MERGIGDSQSSGPLPDPYLICMEPGGYNAHTICGIDVAHNKDGFYVDGRHFGYMFKFGDSLRFFSHSGDTYDLPLTGVWSKWREMISDLAKNLDLKRSRDDYY